MFVLVALYEVVAHADDAAACIQDDGVCSNFYFNAARVASIAYRLWPWGGIAPTHSPEAHQEMWCAVSHANAPITALSVMSDLHTL